MSSLDVSEYSEEGRRILKKVVEEIREQFLVNGRPRQFWFYPTQASDRTLTEPVILKWLRVLSDKGVLHFYRPNNSFGYEQSLALNHGCLGENYSWSPQMMIPFVSGFPPDSFPAIALDIYDTDLNQLIELILRKGLRNRFSKDALDRYYFDGVLTSGINNSPMRKAILSELLIADDSTVEAERIDEILKTDDEQKRNRMTSEIRKELRLISHDVDLVTHKSGRKVDYYQLVVQPNESV